MLHDFIEPDDTINEQRADDGRNISLCSPDWGRNDLDTDLRDALANVVHYLRRAGFRENEIVSLWHSAIASADGDLEDGPEAALDRRLAALREV